MQNKLMWLNAGNETSMIQMLLLEQLKYKFPNDEIIGIEVGSAYGGGVEMGSQFIKGRGKYYGYDTFEGHPRDLAVAQDNPEAYCMDMWYESEDTGYGVKTLDYDYQRKILDDEGLDNAILVKGRVNEHSFDDLEKIHFAIIDLDMINPTKVAYNVIKDKMVIGGYLMFHDALPENHLSLINRFVYEEVLKDKRWKIIKVSVIGNVVVVERWVSTKGDWNNEIVNLNEKS